jgi:P-type E1-E2 ATPase
MLSVMKEAYDDIKRHKRDTALNNYLYETATGEKTTAGDIRVGHIIKVNSNERIPADMIVLYAKYKIMLI